MLLSSVYLAAGGRLEIRVEFPVRRQSVSSLTPATGHNPALHQQLKLSKNESDHSAPSGVEVQESAVAITCIPLHIAHDVALN